jgi:CRISPR-associated endonuclease/helicase Cas3
MLDTAAVTLEVLCREPPTTLRRLAEALRMDDVDAAARFIAAMAGAHDLGKATPEFQRQVEAAGFKFPPCRPSRDRVPHGALTEGLLERWLRDRGVSPKVASRLAKALGAHHGFPAEGEYRSRTEDSWVVGGPAWDEARKALLDEYESICGVGLPQHLSDVPAEVTVALMAIASFCDWIASDPTYFPYGRDPSDPRQYFHDACQRAAEALDAIGWHPRTPLAPDGADFPQVFGFPPNLLQKRVIEAVACVNGPALLLVEAPMGAGKTEAALYAHLVLQRVAGHRGLYVAMPTQTTGNGMFSRVRAFLDRLGTGRPLDLQLQHGVAILHREYQELRPDRVGDRPDETVLAHEWFTPRKRAMLSEYGVGTVDQALLGVLRVRHHFVRLWGLGNRTVVLDEVHAYDLYTSTLIEVLIRWLRRMGSSVILLSATLSRSQRRRLLEAYGASLPESEPPYPRLWLVPQGGQPRPVSIPMEEKRHIRLGSISKDVREIACMARRLAEAGGSVACIVNTVGRAQELYSCLISENGSPSGEPLVEKGFRVGRRVGDVEVYLFHARYPSEERQAREERVLRLFGREGYERGDRPCRAILVATQVVEQSLDVDFDVMITDLAPVDLLLQRAGRLHRFPGRARPASHREARLWVAGLGEDPPDLTGWDRVYSAYVLLRTWCLLRDRQEIVIPADMDTLIEGVYGDQEIDILRDLDVAGAIRERLEEARRQHEEEMNQQKTWACGVAVNPEDLLELPMDRVSALRLEDEDDPCLRIPLTRYGEPSVAVVPLHSRGRLYLDLEGEHSVDPAERPTDDQAERIVRRSVRLEGWWAYQALKDQPIPEGWRRHPLLRHLRCLELDDGGTAVVGGRRVRFDPELGVVYD